MWACPLRRHPSRVLVTSVRPGRDVQLGGLGSLGLEVCAQRALLRLTPVDRGLASGANSHVRRRDLCRVLVREQARSQLRGLQLLRHPVVACRLPAADLLPPARHSPRLSSTLAALLAVALAALVLALLRRSAVRVGAHQEAPMSPPYRGAPVHGDDRTARQMARHERSLAVAATVLMLTHAVAWEHLSRWVHLAR